MALTATTLASALNATDNSFHATAATGATVGGIAKINDEYMVIAEITDVRITVRSRGEYGSSAKAHAVLSPVTFGLVTDLPAPGDRGSFADAPPRDVVSYGANGAIAIPVRDTVALITKATAAAMTLADPPASLDGTMLIIVGVDDNLAHTVTLTTGVYGSAASDVFTWPTPGATAGTGMSIKFLAYKGKWAYLGGSPDVTETSGAAVAVA